MADEVTEAHRNVPRAVVLLSGGMNSTAVLAQARRQGYECYCLSFAYGQPHAVELEAARKIAVRQGARAHRIMDVNWGAIGDTPLHRAAGMEALAAKGIPSDYFPARNIIFIGFALSWAETLEAEAVFTGVSAESGFPDARAEFIAAMQEVARVATAIGQAGRAPEIRAPLLELTKAEVIRLGAELNVDFSMTHSCLHPVGDLACGTCRPCVSRRQGFAFAGLPDPTRYREAPKRR
jgi:7-cyano-7-deazaguanine synthase